MKKFISVNDVENIESLITSARMLKASPLSNSTLGSGKTLGLLFFNSSLRTRLSTQIAAQNLGMHVIVMNLNQDGWKLEFEDGVVMDGDKAEHIKEAAQVISQYCDIIGVRSFPTLEDRSLDYGEQVISAFAEYASVPVVSLESATLHPLQSLTDLVSIREHQTSENPKIVLTWAPHPRALPQAVANSFAQWVLAAGYDLTIAHPEGYELSEVFTKGALITNDQDEAFKDADFVYVKNWSSYSEYGKVLSQDSSWKISMEKLQLTSNARVMHCLPVRRNVVIDGDVLDSDHSIVIEQAGNRVFAAQSVLKDMLENG